MLDRCGHLMAGSEPEAEDLMQTYLTVQAKAAEDAARSAGAVPAT